MNVVDVYGLKNRHASHLIFLYFKLISLNNHRRKKISKKKQSSICDKRNMRFWRTHKFWFNVLSNRNLISGRVISFFVALVLLIIYCSMFDWCYFFSLSPIGSKVGWECSICTHFKFLSTHAHAQHYCNTCEIFFDQINVYESNRW